MQSFVETKWLEQNGWTRIDVDGETKNELTAEYWHEDRRILSLNFWRNDIEVRLFPTPEADPAAAIMLSVPEASVTISIAFIMKLPIVSSDGTWAPCP